MKLVGWNKFTNVHPGSGVMFLSKLLHTLLSAQDGTVRIALFCEGNQKLRRDMKKKQEIVDAYLDNEENTIEGNSTSTHV